MTWNKLSFLTSFSLEEDSSLRPNPENLSASLSSCPLSIPLIEQSLSAYSPLKFSSNQSTFSYLATCTDFISTPEIIKLKKNWKRNGMMSIESRIIRKWENNNIKASSSFFFFFERASEQALSVFFELWDLREIGFLFFVLFLIIKLVFSLFNSVLLQSSISSSHSFIFIYYHLPNFLICYFCNL